TMQRPLLIVNPFASSVSEERLEAVAAALGDVDVRRTERPGHATELAREARGRSALYVFSGDGVFNEVLNGLDGDVPVGFIPGGGANVLPRALGVPRDPFEAARRLAAGGTRRISLGRVNGRRFAFAAGIGLDAEVVRRVDRLGRSEEGGRAGNLKFAWTVARVIGERRGRFAPALDVVGHGRAAFALVANCDPFTYAGPVPVHVAPQARFELGLDFAAPSAVTPARIPRLLFRFATGRGNRLLQGHDLDRIEIRCDVPMPLQADGEDLGDVESAVFEAERNAVNVLV
ncbi:MAG: diacylglycerol/lipid kinase family protein, partial [Gaiellaceae bacterium]